MIKAFSVQLLFGLLLSSVSLSDVFCQIEYVDIEPDVKLTGWNDYSFGLADGASLEMWKHPGDVVVTGHGVEVLYDGEYPASLAAGAIISSDGVWRDPSYATLNAGGKEGHWINVKDRYLGLRFQKAGEWYYAWARLDIDRTPTYFILKDHASHTLAGEQILAGATSVSSVNAAITDPVWSLKGRQLCTNEDVKIDIVSMLGTIAFETKAYPGQVVDLSELPPNFYLLRVTGNAGVTLLKVGLN